MNRRGRLFVAIASAVATPAMAGSPDQLPPLALVNGAGQYVVTAPGDAGDGACDPAPGECTLRDAFAAAAGDGIASSIAFDAAIQGQTITLSQGTLSVTDDTLQIEGGGTVIARDAASCQINGMQDAGEDRLLQVSGGALSLSGLTLQGGCVDGGGATGGGIHLVDGDLTLSDVTVQDNFSTDRGGGVFFYATTGSHTLAIGNSSFLRNSGFKGGGVYFRGSELTVARSTFSSNAVTSGGGGLAAYGMDGSALLSDSTFSGNACIDGGGGVLMAIDAEVVSSTFVDNTSYGADDVRTGYGNTLTVTGSILASADACDAGHLPSGGGNLTTSGSCAAIATEVSAEELGLGVLADNGGPTLTHLPGATSAAVDAGGDCARSTDQRGLPGQVDGDGTGGAQCDVGAVELQAGEGYRVFANGFEEA